MPGTRTLPLALALAALTLAPGLAPDDDRAAGTVPSDPVFTALLIDGSTASGQIRQLGLKEGLVLVKAENPDRTIPIEKLVKLTREGASPPLTSEGGLVVFPDGDRLARSVIGPTGEFNLEIQSFSMGNLAIPLDAILGLILAPPVEPDAVDALVARLRTEPRDAEVLWLANGDKLPGLFAGMTDKKLSFQPATGKVELERPGVVALGFAPGQVQYRRPEGPYLELSTVDGSRLGVTDVRIERGQIVATARFKAEIRLPIGELAKIHALNASVAYLSDREASGAQYGAYVGPTRPYRRNASVSGETLRLAGRPFDRGLGTQSRTLLAYKLEPGSRRFQALVGLDDRAGPLGNVVFKVMVDKKVSYVSPPISPGEPPLALDVDVSGANLLILITDFGERGDVQDHADWVEARIIRGEAARNQ
jgi:NPCBM/NEW2 domain